MKTVIIVEYIINLILLLIFSMHMFQLNSYFFKKHMRWMNKNLKKVVLQFLLILVPSVLLLLNNMIGNIVAIILLGVSIIYNIPKEKSKISLKLTSRVKRMFVTEFILILIGVLVLGIDKFILQKLFILNILSPIICIFANLINSPIEYLVRQRYINDAKRILKGMPNLTIIGVTGSYGKTSVKNFLYKTLSSKYEVLITPKNYNTTMGVVRTINEKLTSMHQLFVCEMGAKYIGDIKEITDIVNPSYGIVTAIGPQHLDTFKSLDNVRKAKLELVDSLPDDGIAFVNWEDENIRNSKITKNMVKFGLSKEADYYATNIDITERGSSFDVVIPDKEPIRIKTRLLGNLNILNIVGAVAIADKLGLTADEIKVGAKYIRPVPHRLELKQNPNGSIIIDDAYNSNIKGAKMALEVLKSFEHKKRILITPGIVELGDKQAEINQELGRAAAEASDFIILVGASQAVPIYNGIKEKHYP